MKKYILIAGVNGAGKSTLYQTLDSLKDIKRVNIDEIVRENGNWRNPADVMTAGKQAIRVIKDYFDKGISFNQETTLCGNSILKNIECFALYKAMLIIHNDTIMPCVSFLFDIYKCIIIKMKSLYNREKFIQTIFI